MKTEDILKYQKKHKDKPLVVAGTQVIVKKAATVVDIGTASDGTQLVHVEYTDGTGEWVELSHVKTIS